MTRSKKVLIICFTLIGLAGTLWFFLSGHSAPDHARYIPSDAIAVVTVNTKRIAADILLGGELKKDTTLGENKTLEKWKKASEENGGIGLSLTADILFFSCTSPGSKQPYTGMVLQLDDDQTLLRFINKELPKLIDTAQENLLKLNPAINYQGYIVVNKGTGSRFCFGFNRHAAVLIKALWAVGDQDFFSKELSRLFKLPKDSSILANENFRTSERRSSDISGWFNYNHPQLKHLFTSKKDSVYPPGYVNAWLDFNKGTGDLTLYIIPSDKKRAAVFVKNHSENDFLKVISTDNFTTLFQADLNMPNLITNLKRLGNEHTLDRLCGEWGLTTGDIAESFTGKADLLFNGFVHYQKKYIAYEYDADFNQVTVEKYRDERIPGFVMRMGMDGSKAMLNLLPKLLTNKRISPWQLGYRLNADIPVYMYPVGSYLYITNASDSKWRTGGKNHSVEEETAELPKHSSGVYCDLPSLRKELQKEFPRTDEEEKKAWDTFRSVSLTADEEPGGRTTFSLDLKLSDPKTNALVQLINLFQEMKKHPF
jgi:hypothetical protein